MIVGLGFDFDFVGWYDCALVGVVVPVSVVEIVDTGVVCDALGGGSATW